MTLKKPSLFFSALSMLSFPVYAETIDTTINEPAPQSEPIIEKVEEPRYISDNKGVFTAVWENDIFAGRDDGYTNGFRFAWTSPERGIPEFVKWMGNTMLPGSDDAEAKNRWTIALGQSMFAPKDLTDETYITTDRPYAGYTYISTGIVSDTGKTLDTALLTVGLVGPASGAEQMQEIIHDIIGADHPMGWQHQIESQVGVGLEYERKWRNIYSINPAGIGIDATPHVGASIGNVYTHALGGATFRLGYDLPADYGPPRIRPSLPGSDFFVPEDDLSGYLFATAEARAVARNIFLDGDTESGSTRLDKKEVVGSLQTGLVVNYGDTRVSYTHVFMTEEFEEQREPEQFGVVTLSLRF